MTLLLVVSIGSLPLFLLVARLLDEHRQRRLEEHASDVLSPAARGLLRRLDLQLSDLGLGVELGTSAVQARDRHLLKVAVVAVEHHAPSLREGLRALAAVARTVSVLMAPPPISPAAWRARRLQALAVACAVAHGVLVSGRERVRARLWLLGRALHMAAQAFRRSATLSAGPAWGSAAAALHDLGVAGAEANLTYEHVVRSLDALGSLAPVNLTVV